MSAPIPALLSQAIEEAVVASGPTGQELFLRRVDQRTAQPLGIKYVPPRFAREYLDPANHWPLRISDSPGFTWGNGLYIAPLDSGVSGAIFGRVGVVGRFDPAGWRLFDARVPANQNLYLQWLVLQPAFRHLTLTMHANLANQYLRNSFRTSFRIDAVIFHPDQRHPAYTDRDDTWMVISDWDGGGALMRRGSSGQVRETWATAIVEDEFEDELGGIGRRRLLGPLGEAVSKDRLTGRIAATWHRRSASAIQLRIGA